MWIKLKPTSRIICIRRRNVITEQNSFLTRKIGRFRIYSPNISRSVQYDFFNGNKLHYLEPPEYNLYVDSTKFLCYDIFWALEIIQNVLKKINMYKTISIVFLVSSEIDNCSNSQYLSIRLEYIIMFSFEWN